MSTTTFEAIRTQQVSVIQALTPAAESRTKFELARAEQPLADWAQGNAAGCFRRFEIRHNHDYDRLFESNQALDGITFRVNHSATLLIAYPKFLAKYGLGNLLDLDDALDADYHQINTAIGLMGGANWVAGQSLCDCEQSALDDLEEVVLRRMVFRLQYDRSV